MLFAHEMDTFGVGVLTRCEPGIFELLIHWDVRWVVQG